MNVKNLLVLGLLGAAVSFGQADGIAVLSSRLVDLEPEEVVFSVAVQADPDSTLTQVVEAIKDLGVTAKNLSGIGSYQTGPLPTQVRLVYNFAVSTPFARYKEMQDRIANLRRTLLSEGSTFDVMMNGVQVSASEGARLAARQRLLPELIEDARRRGAEVAQAAGVSLGPILGMAFGPDVPGASPYYGPYGPIGPSTLRTGVSLNVRFRIQ
jgi:hypothetical protein